MMSDDPPYQGAAIRVGDMKLLVSCPNSTWFKPPELRERSTYDMNFHDRGLVEVALYNITADPTEHTDLSQKLPDVVNKLQERLHFYKQTVVPPLNKPSDPLARNVALKNGCWTPWRS